MRDVMVELKQLRQHGMAGAWGDLVEQGWMSALDPEREKLLRLALSGLAVLCGADQTIESCSGQTTPQPVEPIDWLEWQATWESHRLPEDQRIERSAGPRAHTLGRT